MWIRPCDRISLSTHFTVCINIFGEAPPPAPARRAVCRWQFFRHSMGGNETRHQFGNPMRWLRVFTRDALASPVAADIVGRRKLCVGAHKYERHTFRNRCAHGKCVCVCFPLCNPYVRRMCSIYMQIKRTVSIGSFALYVGRYTTRDVPYWFRANRRRRPPVHCETRDTRRLWGVSSHGGKVTIKMCEHLSTLLQVLGAMRTADGETRRTATDGTTVGIE